MSTNKTLEEKIMAATQRLARAKARAMLQEMRDEHRARELQRRKLLQQRLALGDVVFKVGLEGWQPTEIMGLLLHALDDVGQSPTARLGLRKKGEAFGRGPPEPVAS